MQAEIINFLQTFKMRTFGFYRNYRKCFLRARNAIKN